MMHVFFVRIILVINFVFDLADDEYSNSNSNSNGLKFFPVKVILLFEF